MPGPHAILYYLWRDPGLREQGAALPRATGAIWRILDQHGRIVHARCSEHQPVERPAPITAWQIDFKDVSTVPADPDNGGKRAHVVETLNTIDVGTSVLLGADVREDFTAATSVQAAAELVLVAPPAAMAKPSPAASPDKA